MQHPDQNTNVARTHIQPELERLLGDASKALWILMGAVGLVLLIACGNIANLLLARTAEREREFAVRAAIGASRHRVIRQLLTESLLLSLVGSITGVLLAMACMHLVLPFGGDSIPRVRRAGIDGSVLVFSIVLALVTSVLFSLAPALQLAKVELVISLKEGTHSIARGHDRLRSALVIGQIALGLVLLSGAGMLTASFLYLRSRDPGFKPDHLLIFRVSLPEAPYSRAKQVDFYDRLLERLARLPGVQSAAGGGPLPLSGNQMSVAFNIPERPSAPANRPHSDMAIVTPGYFRTLGIPLLHGRHFTQRDDAKSAQVVIVNKAFADKFFPGEDTIGKRIEPGATADGSGTKIREIVGVVGNAKQSALGELRTDLLLSVQAASLVH
jgi:putative ABC transport system permease protein